MNDNIESAILDAMAFENEDLDLNSLETKLQSELEEQFSDLNLLQEEREHINNPDHLGETVMNVIWEQFMNQVAVTAGEDFIKENHGLTLDLRNEAHIQTAENFANGNIATHNYISKEQLEQNYDRYKNKPHKEFRKEYVDPKMDDTLKRAGELKKQGIDTVTDIYTGKQIPTETKLANGKNNPEAAQREHVKSSAEMYKNPSLQMANSNEELAAIINNPENLQGYTTAERNNRKSDKSAAEMSESDKNEYWEEANERAEKYIKQEEKKGEERLEKEGRKTQKEEAFRIGGKALRTALMSILATLVKEVIGKLVLWLKSAEKSLNTLIDYIKRAIISFASKLKDLLINTTDSILTTIATSIIGPVVGVIKKTFTLLKQGWKSLMEAIQYLRSPENRNKPLRYLLPQVGTIVISGLSGVGAIVLGEFIEKSLMGFPFLAVDIPILGSPANLIGTLMGAIVCGVIGAIAIDLINKYIAKQQENNNTRDQINKKNEILRTQDKLIDIKAQKMVTAKEQAFHTMRERREQAKDTILEAMATIFSEDENEDESHVEYEASKKANYDDRLSKVASELASLLE